jgi:3-oxoacyl-[acyl-carrier protein] reductase
MAAKSSSVTEEMDMDRPSMKLSGKVAWITGSGRGMGRAHAELLARYGADIVVHDVLRDEAAETTAAIKALGRKVFVSHADVTDVKGIKAMVGEAEAELGPIDILVNNAGIGQHLAIEAITQADFDRMFAIHVKGSFFCAQAVIPGMKERRRGKIVNISSIWGMNGAKTATQLAHWNIHVNAVCPGGVITEMPIKVQGWERIREKEQKVPLKRWAQPEEISGAVAFLASAEADFITGQAISPNGGETIVGF